MIGIIEVVLVLMFIMAPFGLVGEEKTFDDANDFKEAND